MKGEPPWLQSELSGLVLLSPKRRNIGDPSLISDLAQAMEDSEGKIGDYAARALDRIGGRRVKQSLEASLLRETAEFAKKEIQAVLTVA